MKGDILIIDDEQVVHDSCRKVLTRSGHRVESAFDGMEGLRRLREQVFDLIILDLKLPGMDGMEVLRQIKADIPDVVVVVITGYATVEHAVEAMKAGAFDFLPKPFTPDELRVIVNRAMEKRALTLENLGLKRQILSDWSDQIVGESEPILEVKRLIAKVAPTDSTVLIQGESGTGKELVARAIHMASPRREKPMIVVDCNTLVETLLESELFGHVKGAFTGAIATKYGRFELANGGTIFLDEVASLPLNIQSKLLRAIQEKEITRVGSGKPIKVDVRIIAATNRDLRQEIASGRFREDLYYRLNVVPILLPPLRERRGDIPLLVHHFIRKFNAKKGKRVRGITEKAMDLLINYDFPGNVRELENIIERAIILTEKEMIDVEDLMQPSPATARSMNECYQLRSLEEVEREHILSTLERLNWNRSKAARVLGIDRKTLLSKMKKYDINPPTEGG